MKYKKGGEVFCKVGTVGNFVEVDCKEIEKALAEGKDIKIEFAEIYGDIDFLNIIKFFEKDTNGLFVINNVISISNCHILGNIQFSVYDFNVQRDPKIPHGFKGLRFSKFIDLSQNQFIGFVAFVGAIFEADVSFMHSTFEEYHCYDEKDICMYPVYYRFCGGFSDNILNDKKYRNDFEMLSTDFTFCSFKKDISFSHAQFKGNVSFRGVSFFDDVKFPAVKFHRSADFDNSLFGMKKHSLFKDGSTVSFEKAIFSGEAKFEDCHFYQAAITFCEAIFEEYLSFRYSYFCSTLWMDDVRMRMPANFIGISFKKPSVISRLFKDISFGMFMFGCTHNDMIEDKKTQSGKKAAEIFIKIFVWLEKKIPSFGYAEFRLNAELINESTSFLFREYVKDENWIRNWRSSSRWFKKYILYYCWSLTSDCGRSIGLWLIWALSVITVFGVLYSNFSCPAFLQETTIGNFLCWIAPELHIGNNVVNNWFLGFYFSIVNFSTLGYGDVTPANGAAQFWIVLEFVTGYMMLGGLISIFANKFARRS